MNKYNLFIHLLVEVLDCAEKEKNEIIDGKTSQWDFEQIQRIVIPEMSELLSNANKGKLFFKYGRKQRLLESTYLITDSIRFLSDTELGRKIIELQKYYNSL